MREMERETEMWREMEGERERERETERWKHIDWGFSSAREFDLPRHRSKLD